MNLKPETPTPAEEKRMATWGTDIPDDLVLDEKLLTKALKKVNMGSESSDLYNPPHLSCSSCYILLPEYHSIKTTWTVSQFRESDCTLLRA